MNERGSSQHTGIDTRTKADLYAQIDLERQISGVKTELARSVGFSEGGRAEREYKVSRNRVVLAALAIIAGFVMSAINLYIFLAP